MADIEKLVEQMNEGRLINITEQVLFPMFQKHLEQKVDTLCTKFRNGETNFIADVAEIAYIKDVLRELYVKQQKGNSAAKELNYGHG